MKLSECNPYVRAAQIQPAVLEGSGDRMAYDHRLFYILEGSGELLLQERTVSLVPDMLILLQPRVGYHFRGKLRVVVLNFDVTRIASHRQTPICPPPLADFDEAMLFDASIVDEFDAAYMVTDARSCKEELLQLVRAFHAADPLADSLCSGLLKKLLADLLIATRPVHDTAELLIERVRRYVALYAAEIKGNELLGQVFGYHPVYLATLFREHTGETLHHAILSQRILLAKQWLRRTDRSIEEIAVDTGFSSRSHFCTVFKEFTGLTPRAYRRR